MADELKDVRAVECGIQRVRNDDKLKLEAPKKYTQVNAMQAGRSRYLAVDRPPIRHTQILGFSKMKFWWGFRVSSLNTIAFPPSQSHCRIKKLLKFNWVALLVRNALKITLTTINQLFQQISREGPK